MKHKNRLLRIAHSLNTAANSLEELTGNLSAARKDLKQIMKEKSIKLPVETKNTKKGSYLKVSYTEEKPKLPTELHKIEIRLVKKKK